jgi:hypothetical protein
MRRARVRSGPEAEEDAAAMAEAVEDAADAAAVAVEAVTAAIDRLS